MESQPVDLASSNLFLDYKIENLFIVGFAEIYLPIYMYI